MAPSSSPLNSIVSGVSFGWFENALESDSMKIPLSQISTDYFPEFLTAQLTAYGDFYESLLHQKIMDGVKYSVPVIPTVVLDTIRTLSAGLSDTVNSYYNGNIAAAIKTFNDTSDDLQFMKIANLQSIEPGRNFYRARSSDKRSLSRPELFHNPYENRHVVTTARYSIPGFPALYLGQSVFAAWRELGEPPINSLFISRLSNKVALKVVQILTALQFRQTSFAYPPNLRWTTGIHEATRTMSVLKFLATYPLSLACSIRTKRNGTFKPEYIIPQLLLQYIVNKNAEEDTLIGIMYPSTKFDFIVPVHGLSLNYVFPVKEVAKTGYCPSLVDAFEITQPTTIEIEELINHNREPYPSPAYSQMIELIPGEYIKYEQTKLFYIENILNNKQAAPVI